MIVQVIQDHKGKPTGVFIPIEDWEAIKRKYPNIDGNIDELPQWQKDILDLRLTDLNDTDKIKSIDSLYDILER